MFALGMVAEWSRTLIKQIHKAEKSLGPKFESLLGTTPTVVFPSFVLVYVIIIFIRKYAHIWL